MNDMETLHYDRTNPTSIEEHARKLVGKTLREAIGDETNVKIFKGKGSFGQLVEKYYFGYEPNSNPGPDFPEAGVELKTSPVVFDKKGELKPKERLVFNIINYMEIHKETWETSSFLKKNSLLLLIFYHFEKEKIDIDYLIKIARLWSFPEKDLKIMREDWEKILGKIRAGKAHEISEGDTIYLGACTKGQNRNTVREQPFSYEPAIQRALALKQSYLRFIIKQSLEEGYAKEVEPIIKDMSEYQKGDTFENLIYKKVSPYIDKSVDELYSDLGLTLNRNAKNLYNEISKKILGVKKNYLEEFEKADIVIRTIRLKNNNMPKEDMSLPAFKYKEIINEDWETSELRETLSKKFFFVIFKYDNSNVLRLKKITFWNIPYEDLEKDVREMWEETVRRISYGQADKLPKKSENRVSHVRPHARNKQDTYETPQGEHVVKKCFWLNAKYLKEQLAHDIN